MEIIKKADIINLNENEEIMREQKIKRIKYDLFESLKQKINENETYKIEYRINKLEEKERPDYNIKPEDEIRKTEFIEGLLLFDKA